MADEPKIPMKLVVTIDVYGGMVAMDLEYAAQLVNDALMQKIGSSLEEVLFGEHEAEYEVTCKFHSPMSPFVSASEGETDD